MTFVNNHVSPTTDEDATFGPEPYDVNFIFPILPLSLESPRIKLIPFIPKLHAELYFNATVDCQFLYDFLPFSMATLKSILIFAEGMRSSPGKILFAIFDKTLLPESLSAHPSRSFAGIIGLNNANLDYLSVDIGPIVVLPAYQKTHVATHSVGTLLRYCLELPSAVAHPGLGLRRVTWLAKPDNIASIRLAEKMGMIREGVLRWTYVVESPGTRTRDGDPNYKLGRDCLLLTMTCEDWEMRGSELVKQKIDR
ncbi:acyl-CoA N-acyltransferase [Dacryopinax primogenitus]|uniref:Acyl-CoA N-acyltransferase n=1 Tax=Dacryopinax primogenitus (strain DJM 731) TaxID=1858805 RepID=M5GFM7_DACPD|nr:acyl-CoA N-acyltransferase [Dacryopinax primogenitus]EJU06452.1 acyl-CoA N-acyltransferase [Dacryopinax primogenitus]